ncbi:hypothetical protein NP493_1089g00006 [Ridgeia piscesae]|uniref:Bcl-2 Bcl-2 homology region 1-3 domain-containing protein n=1 Tax=Ridgeia piscesae TaxID=27915 RepID=A0AAD9NK42_RIDPI|nr:hypothetical protein NP493_1089g00006 [Ridgeia piscesae]
MGKKSLRRDALGEEPHLLNLTLMVLKRITQGTIHGRLQKKEFEQQEADQLAAQTKVLCQEYIHSRLKAASIWPQQLERCARNVHPSDVSIRLQQIGGILETTYPDLYRNVAKHTGVCLRTTQCIHDVLTTAAEVLLPSRSSTTWGRVVALFAIAAGLAEDCVNQGHPDYVSDIIDVFTQVTRLRLDKWVHKQGGWLSLLVAFPRDTKDTSVHDRPEAGVIGAVAGFITSFLVTSHCCYVIAQWCHRYHEITGL